MRRIVIDAQAIVELKNGYAMIIDNYQFEGSFRTDVAEGQAALARIYEVDSETGATVGDPVDEFIIVGKGEADNPK